MANVVLIQGNTARKRAPYSRDMLQQLYRALTGDGHTVRIDEGLPYTEPPQDADVYIGHSRGAGRLRFAPDAAAKIPVGSRMSGAVNHPLDVVDIPPEAYDALPDNVRRAHNRLTQGMLYAIRQRIVDKNV